MSTKEELNRKNELNRRISSRLEQLEVDSTNFGTILKKVSEFLDILAKIPLPPASVEGIGGK